MQYDKRAAFEQGIEIEQFPADTNVGGRSTVLRRDAIDGGMPTGVIRDGSIDWHRDGSGPQETSIGPSKVSKTLLNRFFKETRDKGYTWDWHAADPGGSGTGSHVHLHVADIFDDSPTAWSIAYNSVVELTPFFAPFFCHDWENGFRSGGGSIRRWADPQLTRKRPATVEREYLRTGQFRRPFKSVLFNPSGGTGGKPVTIEIRMNDAHPAVALSGLGLLQRVVANAIEGGWSPKLENREHVLRECYRILYHDAPTAGLMAAMKQPVADGIRFLEGRGIPRVDQLEFESMFDVLRAIQVAFPQTPNTWSGRVQNLVRTGRDDFGPQNNSDSLWNIDAERGEFYWENGPVDFSNSDERFTTDGARIAYVEGAPEGNPLGPEVRGVADKLGIVAAGQPAATVADGDHWLEAESLDAAMEDEMDAILFAMEGDN